MSISMEHLTAWGLLPLVKSLVTETERLEATITSLRAELERKDAALRAICEGDIPRPVAKPYRADGTPSKNDQCEHGQWMYEECGQCIEQFARAALTAQEKTDGK